MAGDALSCTDVKMEGGHLPQLESRMLTLLLHNYCIKSACVSPYTEKPRRRSHMESSYVGQADPLMILPIVNVLKLRGRVQNKSFVHQ